MLRPWEYAAELLDKFARYKNVENLKKVLRASYSNLSSIEEAADRNGVPIFEPFQGTFIGKSLVLSPSKDLFLDLVVDSDKTPQPATESLLSEASVLGKIVEKAISFVRSLWGEENFSSEGTTPENEMSVVQYIDFPSHKYLLTGDTGRIGLEHALNYYNNIYGVDPKITAFEIPHHGSRHNLSTNILNRMFGRILKEHERPTPGNEFFTSIVQACKKDPNHPRKAVERGIHHRGGRVIMPGTWLLYGKNIPLRPNSIPAKSRPYPEEQEG